MLGLLYKAALYFFKSTPLNKGEVDQPPPPEIEVEHLSRELARALERKALADKARGIEYISRGEDKR